MFKKGSNTSKSEPNTRIIFVTMIFATFKGLDVESRIRSRDVTALIPHVPLFWEGIIDWKIQTRILVGANIIIITVEKTDIIRYLKTGAGNGFVTNSRALINRNSWVLSYGRWGCKVAVDVEVTVGRARYKRDVNFCSLVLITLLRKVKISNQRAGLWRASCIFGDNSESFARSIVATIELALL